MSNLLTFQSTLPSREVTFRVSVAKAGMASISIHTSLTGSDSVYYGQAGEQKIFQSTLPSREVTAVTAPAKHIKKFQSTLPSREVTKTVARYMAQRAISIHTSLTGSDMTQLKKLNKIIISIHTSLTGSDSNFAQIKLCFFMQHAHFFALTQDFLFILLYVLSIIPHFMHFSGANLPVFLCALIARTWNIST